MKRKSFWLSSLVLIAQLPAIAGNCGAGAGVGSPHCSGGPRVPVTQQAGVQPATGTQPPARLGTITPDHHNTALVPAGGSPVTQPTAALVPQSPHPVASTANPAGWFYLSPSKGTPSGLRSKPVPYSTVSRAHGLVNPDGSLTQRAIGEGWVRLPPVATPALQPQPPQPGPLQAPQLVAQPMQVPQQVPTPTPQATPQQVPQAVAQPMRVPQQVPIPTPQVTPQQVPQLVAQPILTPQQVPTPTPQVTPSQVPQLVAQPMLVPQQVPTPTPQVTPQQVPQLVAQPMLVPQQAPTPTPQATPSQVPQLVAQPMLAPQQVPTPTPQATPSQVPQLVAQPMLVPQQVPTPTPPVTPQRVPQPQTGQVVGTGPGQLPVGTSASAVHPHALLVHAPYTPRAVTSGFVAEPAGYTLEFIEPGLQSRKVKVYRTGDAAEQLYKDTIPLDKGGFQIIVVGTRNPGFVH